MYMLYVPTQALGKCMQVAMNNGKKNLPEKHKIYEGIFWDKPVISFGLWKYGLVVSLALLTSVNMYSTLIQARKQIPYKFLVHPLLSAEPDLIPATNGA